MLFLFTIESAVAPVWHEVKYQKFDGHSVSAATFKWLVAEQLTIIEIPTSSCSSSRSSSCCCVVVVLVVV